ncbi:MAG TPA: ABC transporter permease [Thermoleophilaceae bacterium]|nr:ABC transporter permease [Thermoleophilaceae bacterium]
MNDGAFIEFLVIAIGAGTPLVWASVGEILTERSGILNLGVEGMMLVGAVTAYWVAVTTGTLMLGVLAGALAGAALAGIHGVLSIGLRANQIVSGIALVILGSGLSTYLGSGGDDPLSSRALDAPFGQLLPDALADLPLVGPVFFGHDLLVYGSWAFTAAAALYLSRTRAGLEARAVGEDPAAADAAGITVNRVRYVHTLLGGAAAGVAGSYLTLALFGSWQDNLSAGTGWIAIAIVIFSAWRPLRALLAAYLFGALTSFGFNLQLLDVPLPLSVLAALPYVITLAALIVLSNTRASRRLSAPAALARPYWRESR